MITILGFIFGFRKQYKALQEDLSDANYQLGIYRDTIKILQGNNGAYKSQIEFLNNRINILEDILHERDEQRSSKENININHMYV